MWVIATWKVANFVVSGAVSNVIVVVADGVVPVMYVLVPQQMVVAVLSFQE